MGASLAAAHIVKRLHNRTSKRKWPKVVTRRVERPNDRLAGCSLRRVAALQIAVGVVLVVLGVVAFLRTRKLLQFMVDLEEPPLSQAQQDRITNIAYIYHIIAGLTLLSGLGVVLLALAD
jgi:hypothetical protein